MEGGKEGDIQIKVEECAVKNFQIRLGLTLNVWLLGEREEKRKRVTEMERREILQEIKEELSERFPDRGQLCLINVFVSHTKFKGLVASSQEILAPLESCTHHSGILDKNLATIASSSKVAEIALSE